MWGKRQCCLKKRTYYWLLDMLYESVCMVCVDVVWSDRVECGRIWHSMVKGGGEGD